MSEPQRTFQIANKEIETAIEEVLQYNWEAELNDFINNDQSSSHIFRKLVQIDQWLYGHAVTAEELARDAYGEIR